MQRLSAEKCSARRARYVLIDYDAKFVPGFDAILTGDGVEVKCLGPRSPNLNAYAERWVQAAKQECLDHFVFFGEGHLRHVVRQYEAHFNAERPHQAVGNVPLSATGPDPPADGTVVCHERLGGLLKHYARKAA